MYKNLINKKKTYYGTEKYLVKFQNDQVLLTLYIYQIKEILKKLMLICKLYSK